MARRGSSSTTIKLAQKAHERCTCSLERSNITSDTVRHVEGCSHSPFWEWLIYDHIITSNIGLHLRRHPQYYHPTVADERDAERTCGGLNLSLLLREREKECQRRARISLGLFPINVWTNALGQCGCSRSAAVSDWSGINLLQTRDLNLQGSEWNVHTK